MEFIFEILVEVVVVWILGYPGALVRWAIRGFKKGELKKLVKEDGYINSLYFILLLIPVILIINLF